MPRLPVKKIRKQFKLLLLLVLLTSAVWFTYLHIHLGKTIKLHFNYGKDGEKETDTERQRDTRSSAATGHRQNRDAGDSGEDDVADEQPMTAADGRSRSRLRKFLTERHQKLPWKPEFKGQVNLHVFEDWCGSSVAQLRKNLHFPLYPHTRTTLKKLAVAPKWKNYGLRIFGFLHPYRDGDFQFSVSSDDNSEFWLSPDESPLNARLLVFVGQLGTEWSAPGEFNKFRSQSSKSVHLMSSRRYYFELLHKQDDKGSDHVEVGWRPFLPGLKYEVIDSAYISLYTDESSLKMNSVAHIPQTSASHVGPPGAEESGAPRHGADMLKPDPRDTFYSTPMISPSRLANVLPACLYSPTYVVKDFPMARYQGLQFVYLPFVYPNDFTRLTHMERENKCFYRESPIYLEKFGFYKYMKMDDEEEDDRPFFFPNPDDFQEEDETEADEEQEPVGTHSPEELLDLGRGPSGPVSLPAGGEVRGEDPRHREDAPSESESRGNPGKSKSDSERRASPAAPFRTDGAVPGRSLSWSHTGPAGKLGGSLLFPKMPSVSSLARRMPNEKREPKLENRKDRPVGNKVYVTRPRPDRARHPERRLREEGPSRRSREIFPGVFFYQSGKTARPAAKSRPGPVPPVKGAVGSPDNRSLADAGEIRTNRSPGTAAPRRPDSAERVPTPYPGTAETLESRPDPEPDEGEMSDYGYEETEPRPGWAEENVDWRRTFSVNPVDFELLRSDWNDLRCNVSGNLQLAESEVVDVLAQYMEKLNRRNGGIYTLLRIVNVEKRRDSARGNRYLVELELMERGRSVVRLSEYIYVLLRRGGAADPSAPAPASGPPLAGPPSPTDLGAAYAEPLLCQPVTLRWRNDVMVHFVVPVKNQARWVQQFIWDMEHLHRKTEDDNFSVIIVDFESEDMDVEQALRESALPRYEYLRREGNFERSAGLQMGVDTIEDSHSVIFLCDLHIHFPPNILESIRKHCVEGRLAFAPIVMRLGCGSSPKEPDGFWEVNGFGLFGIYKSDFDQIGGMNTEEFKDRWGGEDWELLDRVLQNGLEVERLRLRNFFHYYHSKRGMWNAQKGKSIKG
ncbi:N-acetyl-beta-glucosaminyl-glycoprotein 4-beta-N-acetylgalactosaminyltransferase 1 [Corythoichthys intestinalis]|uniref:N-acetyl-beta-glucosaminyl-glycoprotein 4-beta-N-acetylgalactosaminyltransferase 1 n=1 Tax=Corythoichthys intestinalis TaxID=161448 RepID=UPI0025A6692D|nr:N-acetyl-beta-glucosaminyl-glycoprotein 4-beta-N-acetylgalactosaminyltransferase 1 [Corythoichthys intestinalis]XP_057693422.1 N-acetyl-beta-glucosaminyl-glycoprotein 4-beta-N-acetylgalactosaminyltransferase 1 [Corythoichthys intestinalis]XP_057693423.1 N-acetyl-beta-glucosaminyl-glycoprotein 4-beta-N-acetylgalactosaminyltransferase 1 [Corythoichthys intestinalis]XP_057693424.1 N-acetyl-beta-glucosaminyl-glycoprotein 4-beta-N-acetylgalactosaminyltransferase 1 [Corythoichthys intestinalis]XP_